METRRVLTERYCSRTTAETPSVIALADAAAAWTVVKLKSLPFVWRCPCAISRWPAMKSFKNKRDSSGTESHDHFTVDAASIDPIYRELSRRGESRKVWRGVIERSADSEGVGNFDTSTNPRHSELIGLLLPLPTTMATNISCCRRLRALGLCKTANASR